MKRPGNVDPLAVVDYLVRQAKEAQGIELDSELARRMKVARATLSQWQTGTCPVPHKRVMELASMAGLDPGELLVVYIYAAGDEDTRKNLWAFLGKLSKTLEQAGIRAAAILMTILALTATTLPGRAYAASETVLLASAHKSVSYVRRRWGRRRYFPGFRTAA